MSWSVNESGTPEQVAEKLTKHADGLTGQSRVEYDAALPFLVGLVRQTYTTPEGVANNYPVKNVRIVAFGSGATRDGAEQCRDCQVKIELA